jgi:Spy/CpxP family protein refolding chaperone
MSLPKRMIATGLGLALLVGLGTIPLAAQDNAAAEKSGKDGTRSSAKSQEGRRLPNYFGQIGLSPEQRESIYKIKSKTQEHIDSLEKQLASARADLMRDCESVLTDAQKQLLDQRRHAKTKSAKDEAKPTEPAAKTGER